MVYWYVVAKCEWLGPNFYQAEYLDMDGYTEGTMDSQTIQTDSDVGDPFLSYGIDTETWVYGQAQMEIGLVGSHRIRINSSGVRIWTAGDVWKDPLTEGGGAEGEWFKTITGITNDVVADQVDDTLTLSSANNRLTIVGNSETDTINFNLVEGNINHNALTNYDANRHFLQSEISITESQISNLDHLTEGEISLANLLEKSHANLTNVTANQHISNLTDIPTRNHNDLANLNAGDSYEHITQTQKDALHAIYTLEVHDNTKHDPDHLIDPILLTERAEPDTPAADTLKLFAFDEAGFTTLRFIEPDGNVIIIGECMYKIGRNTSGAEIARGKLVCYNGTTTGKHPNFSLAKADSLTTMPVIGITCDVVANNGWARLMIMGRFDGLDTYNYENGDILYASASTAGEMTDVFPPSPLIDQEVGIVEIKHAVTGVVLISLAVMQGRNDGTIRQSFQIGDGASGDVTLGFNGDAGNDGSIIYDVSEDEFVVNRDVSVPNLITAGLVDGKDVSGLCTTVEAIAAVLADDAYVKNIGDTMTGTLTVPGLISNGNIQINIGSTVDGVDISTVLNQDVKNSASPTFVGLTLSADLVTSSTIDGVDLLALKTDYDAKINQAVKTTSTPSFTGLISNGNISMNIGSTVDGVDISTLPALIDANTTVAEVNTLIATHTGDDNAHHEVFENVLEDLSPQLGGDLDLNAKDIKEGAVMFYDVSARTIKPDKILLSLGSTIDEFASDVNLGGDNSVVSTTLAVKTYADTKATAAEAVQAVEDAGLVLSAGKIIEYDGTPADGTYTGLVMNIDTTGCVTFDAVYVDGINSVAKAQATGIATMPAIGVVVAVGKVLTHGAICSTASWAWAAGAVIYINETVAGELDDAIPALATELVQVMGVATGTDTIHVNPSLDWVVRK